MIDSATVSGSVGGNVEVVVGFWTLLGVTVIGITVVGGIVVAVVTVTIVEVALGGCGAAVVGLFVVGGNVKDVDDELVDGGSVVVSSGRVVRGWGEGCRSSSGRCTGRR